MRVGHEEANMPAPQSFIPALFTLAALAVATKAGAAELSNLDAGLPTAIDDAFAVTPGRLELQGAARYDRIHGRDAVQLLPRVQLGVIEGLQVNLALPYTVGSGRRYDPGSAGGGLLYNLNRERDWLPAFALAVDYSAPIGPERRSAEVGLTGIATKTITPAVDRRLNLNVAWLRALNPDEEERRDRYRVIVGYSQLVAPNIVAVLDYSRESQERRERDANIVEAGLRYQFTDAVTLGAGAGFGVGRDSPRFRAIASIQVGFGGR